MWDREGALKKLIAYHKKQKSPLFMPADGWCDNCCRDIIWPLVFGLDGKGHPVFPVLVTGCPRCNYSYCD